MMNTPKAKGQRPKPDSPVASGQLSVAKTTDHGSRTTGKARYIMIGGFLGAGKTTSVVRLAQRLTDQGLKVGLITNDQGSELVDTAMLRSRGFATEEIPGGCFCCRFNSLVDAAHKLTVSTRPDMFIAEPVGSCTDLVATVCYALYAEGEALLGWLNCTAQLEDRRPFDANAVLKRLASRIQAHLQREGAELAHLKMTFSSEESLGGIAVINLVRNDYVPEVSLALEEPVHSGQLVVNLRAEAAPEVLRDSVRSAVAGLAEDFGGLQARLEHLEHFRPGKPQPTHRLTAPV